MPPQRIRIALSCTYCGVSYERRPSELQKSALPFCGSRCWYAYRRQYTRDHWWERVDKTGDCWLWTGAVTKFGHGKLAAGGKHGGWTQTHRVAWEEASGQAVPEGMHVLHTCDVPNCVRNDVPGVYVVESVEYLRLGHLFLAPERANRLDCWEKGRSAFDPDWWSGKKRDSRNGKYVPT